MSEVERCDSCEGHVDDRLTLYVDGELPQSLQPQLFAHLAVCETCRQELEAIFQFRRALRQENVSMPPAFDNAFLNRLARHKSIMARVDRRADRQPLWMSNQRVSIRAVVLSMAAILLLTFGFGLRADHGGQTPALVTQAEELVEFQVPQRAQLPVYVFFPGLTVEADMAAE